MARLRTGGAHIMIGDSGLDYSPCSLLSVFTSEPTTYRWCPLAARSKCQLAVEFRRLSSGNL